MSTMQIAGRKLLQTIKSSVRSLRRTMARYFIRACAWVATTVYCLVSDWRGWRPVLTRTAAHFAVVIVAVGAIALSNMDWLSQAAPALSASVLSVPLQREETPSSPTDGLITVSGRGGMDLRPASFNSTVSVGRVADPRTIIPDRPRLGVVTYTVQAGDSVEAIAASFGLDPTTISWANPAIEDAPDLLRIGQEVVILPVDGVYHEVAEGDTLASIADTYEVEPQAILGCTYNDLGEEGELTEGVWLIVPGGEKPYVPKVVTSYTGAVPEGARGTGRFQWPVLGRITQGYWYGHRAIDVGAPTGSALQAADGGFVSFAGWTDVGYGNLVVLDHANGFVTYYGHMNKIYVFEGQAVERGQVLGTVGNTGYSTGPHLHFEVRYYGVPHNPRAYLP